MPNQSDTVLSSSRSELEKIRETFAEFAPQDAGLYQHLAELYEADLRQIVDVVVKLKPAERKGAVAPYESLSSELKKYTKSGLRTSPAREMKRVASAFPVLLGWLKNRHKYKDGELNPPASDDSLRELEAAIKRASAPPPGSPSALEGNTGFSLHSEFVDSYRVCDGMSDNVRVHGYHIFPVAKIAEVYADFANRDAPSNHLPFADDGAGNYLVFNLIGGTVSDLNHEDDMLSPVFPSLAKFVSKAHKVTR